MDIAIFFKGLLIGFSIAAPVGPIGILCIKRTLASGRIMGFSSGLGAATADAVYGSIAAFGLTIISNFLLSQQFWFRLVGGLFLFFLGIRAFFSRPLESSDQAATSGLWSAYVSTFFLTLTNPLTILSFAAIFAGLGLVNAANTYGKAAQTVLGVFLGSTSWWFVLSTFTGLFKQKIKPAGLRWVNRISGLIILGFGLVAILSLIS